MIIEPDQKIIEKSKYNRTFHVSNFNYVDYKNLEFAGELALLADIDYDEQSTIFQNCMANEDYSFSELDYTKCVLDYILKALMLELNFYNLEACANLLDDVELVFHVENRIASVIFLDSNKQKKFIKSLLEKYSNEAVSNFRKKIHNQKKDRFIKILEKESGFKEYNLNPISQFALKLINN